MVSQAAIVFEFSSDTYLEACLALLNQIIAGSINILHKCFSPVNSLCGHVCGFFKVARTQIFFKDFVNTKKSSGMASQAANVFEFSSNTYLEDCLALFKSNNRCLDQYFSQMFCPGKFTVWICMRFFEVALFFL